MPAGYSVVTLLGLLVVTGGLLAADDVYPPPAMRHQASLPPEPLFKT